MNKSMFIYKTIWAIFLLLLVPFHSLWAQETSIADIERINFPLTSYEAIGKSDVLPKQIDAALFVMVDQTVGFSRDMEYHATEAILEWMKPGRYIEITKFSSTVKGHYAEKVLCGLIDPELPSGFRSNLRRSEWVRFQKLHREQIRSAILQVQKVIQEVMKESNRAIPHSDIVATIYGISHHIKTFPAKRKVLFIISDMLENSGITSFYYKGHVRLINPDEELKKVEGFQADFGNNVTVYVLGLGYFWGGEGAAQEKYLDPKRASRIARFWRKYFEAGHARIGEIGMPMMYGGLQ